MDIEEASIEFINKHIDTTFKGIMGEYIIENLYWIDEEPNKARAIAEMVSMLNKDDTNLIVLFPPFYTK
ncbi:MAG: hypothetical protein CL833_07370 [Crocinitomicaceae bacterium]|nr:hypothetical protein [Crocinitomicaceae bacterium]|tara:strand:+ start:959 stop:1165 length:207 start_codon:yes stop_codon:yes gene_type:complete